MSKKMCKNNLDFFGGVMYYILYKTYIMSKIKGGK